MLYEKLFYQPENRIPSLRIYILSLRIYIFKLRIYIRRLRIQFSLDGKKEIYQFYRVGKVGYLVLDGGEDKPDSDIEYGGLAAYDEYREEQAEWLAGLVETETFKSAAVRIVFLHIPPMHSDWHGCQHIGKLFVPILNRANIDVLFSGHQHRYRYQPAGSPLNFPLIVNGADSVLKCEVTDKSIEIEMVNSNGELVQKHTFPIK